ncbi:hypothetical protein Tco_0261083, partial [Tanacetum coccineum]
VWYAIGVATLRALVRASDKTSGDARSWYMISGDAKSWVLDCSAYIHVISSTGASGSKPPGNTKKGSRDQPVATRRIKSAKSNKKKNWKPTGKVFSSVGYRWLPTGQNFTIDGTKYRMTRITSTLIVAPKKTSQTPVITSNPKIKVYLRRIKIAKFVSLSSEPSILGPRHSNKSEPNRNWGSTLSNSPSSSHVHCRFGKDHVVEIKGYGDYQIGNVMISRVYYMEGLGHNLFSVGQFFDSDREVAFLKHTSYVRDLEGINLLQGYWGSTLYTMSLEEMMQSSLIFLLSEATKTKSWLWHQRLPHLISGAINDLAK